MTRLVWKDWALLFFIGVLVGSAVALAIKNEKDAQKAVKCYTIQDIEGGLHKICEHRR